MSKDYFNTIHLLITKGHWITDQVSKDLKEYGISEPQYNVMRTLVEAKGTPLSVQEVQAKMVQPGSNVTRIVDKLQNKGLVERCECPSNRRRMDLTLTEEGKTFLKKLDRKVAIIHKPIMKKLNESELESLRYLLGKINRD